jgi:hypothetical protein
MIEIKKMKINYRTQTHNSSGGNFKPPFERIDEYISNYLACQKITSSIEKIKITFAYSTRDKKDNYFTWYNTVLPYVRFSEKRTVVSVGIPFGEVRKWKDFESDMVFLSEKFIEAFDVIASKLKKGDVLDCEQIKGHIRTLTKTATEEALLKTTEACRKDVRKHAIDVSLQGRSERQSANLERSKLIRDIRLYYHFDTLGKNIGRKYFAPYDIELCEVVLEKLRVAKFKCPVYNHLYISVAESLENALYHAIQVEDWFVHGVAVLENPTVYQNIIDEKKKQKMVFGLIKEGLLDIAKIDKLDMDTLNGVLADVERTL